MPGPIDSLEEAIHLLRRTSAMTYVYYLVGVIPFTIFLFQLFADASYHRYTSAHLSGSAARLALSYAWMKGFQAIACRRLSAACAGEPVNFLRSGALLRMWLAQVAVHPWGILITPMAAVAVVPSPYVDAFFQNASILLNGNRGDFLRCLQFSKGQMGHLLTLQGIIFIFRIVAFVCLYSTFAALPFLGHTLFGIDTSLTRSYQWLLSMPFIFGVGFLSYLMIDLLLKSLYVVRIREIECETSGKDLLDRLAAIGYGTAAK